MSGGRCANGEDIVDILHIRPRPTQSPSRAAPRTVLNRRQGARSVPIKSRRSRVHFHAFGEEFRAIAARTWRPSARESGEYGECGQGAERNEFILLALFLISSCAHEWHWHLSGDERRVAQWRGTKRSKCAEWGVSFPFRHFDFGSNVPCMRNRSVQKKLTQGESH